MTIKLNGSTAGSVALDAPASTTSNADIAFKLPVADGSAGQVLTTDGSGNLSWVTLPTPGINMIDRWHLSSNYSLSNAQTYYTINQHWARTSTVGYNPGIIGSAMTESSGLFTFPSTGVYLLIYDCITGTSTDQLNMWSYITVGSDTSGTNYVSVKASSGDSGTMNTVTHTALIDVTDTSTVKVFFRGYANTNGAYLSGSSLGQRCCVTFIRIGDT